MVGMPNQDGVGRMRRLQPCIAARDTRQLRGLLAFDQVNLCLCAFKPKREFASIRQQSVLIKRAVKGRTKPLGFARSGIEPVEPSLHIAVLALKRSACGIH